ncbi:MAG: phosphate signaling complex protein PhoU [Desulfurivibrionaceae bacterium]
MHLHRELAKVRQEFLDLGAMVEDRVKKACSVIQTRDQELIDYIINSDHEIDEKEIELEEECLKILALHQPVARDLRFIITVIKVNNEVERIADYAVKIAKRVRTIIRDADIVCSSIDFQDMADKVINMLKMSLNALVEDNAELAHQVFILDDEVDDLQKEAYRKIRKSLDQPPGEGEHSDCLLNMFLLARHLERIGDRSINIAEEVIYLVEGEIIRGDHP